MTKKFLILLLLLTNAACVKTVVKSSDLANSITRLHRDTNQIKADLMIEKQIKEDIENSKKEFLRSNNLADFGYYDVKVIEARVMLTGIVFDGKTKSYMIEKIADNLKVRSLLNEVLLIEQVGTFSMKIKDYFLEISIAAKLFFKSKIKSLNYEISVIDGNAYIIGIAEDNDERDLLLNMISTVNGVKQVISHVITLDSSEKLKVEYN